MDIGNSGGWTFDTTFGQPIVKDGCGVFGIIRKSNSPKISNITAVTGLACIKYRGSNLGAGYACFDSTNSEKMRIKAFVSEETASTFIQRKLSEILGDPLSSDVISPAGHRQGAKVVQLEFTYSKDLEDRLESAIDEINNLLLSHGKIDGRIFSYGQHVSVFKEVGYPLDVARMYGLDQKNQLSGDLWIGHTRQPTNSPGSSPIWSHPFCAMDCAIVHNGDISSFGANLEFLNSLGFKSHVGTDSEAIARLLNFLIRHEGLSVVEAARILTNPFEENSPESYLELVSKYKGAKLDGPFAVVAGYTDEDDAYLIALIDRSKFRPIIIGEDESNFYVASEENQIRILSPNARVWTPEPGSFFIASVKSGLISSGTRRELRNPSKNPEMNRDSDSNGSIDTIGLTFPEINRKIQSAFDNGSSEICFRNLIGQRYLGIGISTKKTGRDFSIRLDGYPGNCLANLNDGATFEVHGNVGDDLADTMHSGRIIIHGNARDVVGQALQGGEVFVRGSVGNRAAIQMREYKSHRPYLVVGETADDYLAEYMAGGVVVVLNLSNDQFPVGNYVGTGMVGGSVYIRGRLNEGQIGLLPKKADILSYLIAEKLDGNISPEVYDKVSDLEYPSEKALFEVLPGNISKRIRNLFFRGKYSKPISVEHRTLTPDKDDLITLKQKMEDFFNAFEISMNERELVMNSEFTIISTIADEDKETQVPPQEVPVEE